MIPPQRHTFAGMRMAAAFVIMTAFLAAAAGGYVTAAGFAAGVYLFSRADKGNVGRLVCAALFLAATAVSPWGALIALCLLIAILLTETWLAGGIAIAAARVLATGLAFKALFFTIVPDIAPHLDRSDAGAQTTFLLAAAAVGVEVAGRYRRHGPTGIDPLLVSLLTVTLLTYSLAAAVVSVGISYPKAIFLTTAGLCVVLAAAALLTAPFTGGGPSLQSVRHAFSLRVPIEEWVARISAIAGNPQLDDFARQAMEEFIKLPGVVGVSWRVIGADMSDIGARGRQTVALQCPPLYIRLHVRRRASPWEWFNYYLLARITAEYYASKQREEQHRADNLSRALYTTGARLTHDIKNILHTLTALTSSENDALIKQQLPLLRERLQSTLRKLQNPADNIGAALSPADEWWRRARERHAPQGVVFRGGAGGDAPVELFDLALENFIGNALVKRQTAPMLNITATLGEGENGAELRVRDDGDAIAEATAAALFAAPVASHTGFGVGLYQTAVEAKKHGHAVFLEDNAAGKVTFALRRNAARGGDNALRAGETKFRE